MVIQSAKSHRKNCHRWWLTLCHAVILISNAGTSGEKHPNTGDFLVFLK